MLEPDLYRARFSKQELDRQRRIWAVICRYLQRWVNPDGVTLDLGAGHCHFINNIRSLEKIAVDINAENLDRHAAPGVHKLAGSGAQLSGIASASVDTVFASNVYEHFLTREDVAASFREVRRVLRPHGRFIILQPNFAYTYRQYFDFFDHRLAFTHKGMVEGLRISGFEVQLCVPRFLPYTSKGRLPSAPWLVSAYLRCPAAWRILGGQMLIVAAPAAGAGPVTDP